MGTETIETRVPISREVDVVTAQFRGREIAAQLGFSRAELAQIATAISEVARNIVLHAGCGELRVAVVRGLERRCVVVVARDRGPGIADVERAMLDGYTTGGGLGIGLPGARRLMDEFAIESEVGCGTTVTMTKWAPGTGDARGIG